VRDAVIDYVGYWAERTELPAGRLVGWIGLGRSKYQAWKCRYGKVNEHKGLVPITKCRVIIGSKIGRSGPSWPIAAKTHARATGG